MVDKVSQMRDNVWESVQNPIWMEFWKQMDMCPRVKSLTVVECISGKGMKREI